MLSPRTFFCGVTHIMVKLCSSLSNVPSYFRKSYERTKLNLFSFKMKGKRHLIAHTPKTSITAAFPSVWVKAAGIGTVTFRDWLMWYCICSQVCVWYQSAASRPSVKVGESRSPTGLCLTDRVSLSIPWPLRSRQDLKSQPCQLCDWTKLVSH